MFVVRIVESRIKTSVIGTCTRAHCPSLPILDSLVQIFYRFFGVFVGLCGGLSYSIPIYFGSDYTKRPAPFAEHECQLFLAESDGSTEIQVKISRIDIYYVIDIYGKFYGLFQWTRP